MSSRNDNEPDAPSYEDALAELERLVQRMEDGQMPLEQMLDSYKRGAELLELCRSRLARVEEQVKLLEDGQLRNWSPPAGVGSPR
jgi:exodeoxyribonuclease VII small subunit